MGSVSPGHVLLTPDSVRNLIATIKPAAHGIAGKTFANIQSNLRAALALADIIDAKPLLLRELRRMVAPGQAVASDRSLAFGLGQFFNFCAAREIVPVRSMTGRCFSISNGFVTARSIPTLRAAPAPYPAFGTAPGSPSQLAGY